jgi:hypothetical protein
MVEAPFGVKYTTTLKSYHGTRLKGMGCWRIRPGREYWFRPVPAEANKGVLHADWGCQVREKRSAKQGISIATQRYSLELTVIEREVNVYLRWGSTLSD